MITPIESYLEHAHAGDHSAASSLALDLVDHGVGAPEVVQELLVPAQEEVGHRWHRNDWSVADEHIATNVADTVLAALRTGARAQARSRAHIAIVCAEREWHLLPARMAADQLRVKGWDVSFLGGSVPAAHLRSFLVERKPDAVGVSASLPLTLPGAARSIAVAREVGVPVLAGGRAFGPGGRWAAAVGAHGWGDSGISAAGQLDELCGDRLPDVPGCAWPEAYRLIEADKSQLVSDAMVRLRQAFPAMSSYSDAQLRRTEEDFEFQLEFLAVAALVDDPELFMKFAEWLFALLVVRRVPPEAVRTSLEIIATLVAPISTWWAEVARVAAESG